MADLLYIGGQPFLGDGNPVNLCKILEEHPHITMPRMTHSHIH